MFFAAALLFVSALFFLAALLFCCRFSFFCRRFIFSRRFTLLPPYFIVAASVFLSPLYFVVAGISLLPLKQQRKYKAEKKKKRLENNKAVTKKNMQRLGMSFLGFRSEQCVFFVSLFKNIYN